MKNLSIHKKLAVGAFVSAVTVSVFAGPSAVVSASSVTSSSQVSQSLASGVSGTSNSTNFQSGSLNLSASGNQGNPLNNASAASENGQQIGRLGRQILNWAKSKGRGMLDSARNAIKRGVNAVKNWIKYQLPRHLADAAISLGLDALAQWIIANWPW